MNILRRFFGSLHLERPSRSDGWLMLVYWLLAAPIIGYSYFMQFGLLRAGLGIVYTIGFDTTAVYLLVYGFLPQVLARRNLLVLFGGLIVFVIIDGHLYWLGYWLLFNEKPLEWQPAYILHDILRHPQSYGMLGILLAGKRYLNVQQHLLAVQKAQTESELRSLKAQIDPHFLFNNLNVLRGLIQQDPAVANEYLSRFANLYRFLIRHKDEDFVTLAEELQFVDEYIYLLRHRFGAAYAFRQQLAFTSAAHPESLLVVPGTLQLLVENAIKHNAGDDDDPLLITIRLSDTELVVEHALRPKRTAIDSTGTGLPNLRERYRLLFDKAIVVENTGTAFRVRVPVLPAAPRRQATVPTAATLPAR